MIKYLQHHFFEHTADQRPSSICLRYGDQSYTYAKMEDLANRTAHALLQAGVESNDRICILSNKDVHLYAGILGALKSGGCWVPLSRSFPAGRIKRLLTSLGPKAVLVDSAHRGLLDAELAGHIKVLVMSEIVEDPKYSTKRPSVQIASSDLAYVVFTSGSTGTPKGVMVDHQGTSNFLNHALDYFHIEPESHFGHFSEITFDPSIFDLFVCWGMGGTLVPFNKPSYKVNPLLFFKDNEINVIFCVPNLLEKVVDLGQIEEPGLLHLKHILLTGEVVKRPLVKALYSSLKDVTIYNMYGTTETAIISHWCVIPDDNETEVPVGVVMPGLRVDLVDQDGKLGDVGESIVSGTQISRGYWDNEFLTQQKFRPYRHNAHCRAYYTGDILRRDKNGLYYYQGRQDDQTKIRGHRVELGEVESAFLSFAEVNSAAVVAFSDTDSSYDQKLFAFVEGDRNLDLQSLKKEIADILPAYMMPSDVTILNELPRNQNGKIDRQALKQYIGKKDAF